MFSDNNRFGRFLVLGWRGRTVLKHRVDHKCTKKLKQAFLFDSIHHQQRSRSYPKALWETISELSILGWGGHPIYDVDHKCTKSF